ncbi:MAG: hypothetical protein OEV42_09875 [Deltaproteobacteria bacterium]|nr:hypothetical protein [Deltaproteobacteria bacterium]
MIEIIIPLILFILIIFLGFIFKSLFYRTKLGKFKNVSVKGNKLIVTDYGQFLIERDKEQIRIKAEKTRNQKCIAYSEIAGLKYEYDRQFAFLPEFLFGDWPLFKKHEDTYEWYHIYLELRSNEKIPLYSIGNYEQRQLALGWKIFLEKIFLEKLGVYEDIEKSSSIVFNEIMKIFREAKVHV